MASETSSSTSTEEKEGTTATSPRTEDRTDGPTTDRADGTAAAPVTAGPTEDAAARTEATAGSDQTPASSTGSPSGGAAVAGGAVVSAGLGLASLTGTSLGDMFRAREELLGQIAAFTGGGGNQIDALYTSPWHTVALVNGVFALLAAIIGAVLAFGPARKPGAPAWGRALALGGFVLGIIGIVVSGGMYIDLFAAPPQMPAMPAMPGMGG